MRKRAWMILAVAVFLLPVFALAQNDLLTSYDLFKIQSVVEVAVSPSGQYVAYTVNVPRPFSDKPGSDYRELHVLDLKTGESRAYLSGKKAVYSLSWSPDSRMIAFRGNLGDVKKTQVYGMYVDGGAPFPLTHCRMGVLSYAFAPDGKSIAFVAAHSERERRKKLIEKGFNAEIFQEEMGNRMLMLQDLSTGKMRRLTREGSVFDFVWSPDGRYIAAAIAPHNTTDDSYMFKRIHLVDVAEGTVKKLVENPGKLGHMAWSPDSRHLAFVAGVDEHDPVAGSLFVVDVEHPQPFDQLRNYSKDFEGSVTWVAWKDWHTLLFSADEGVNTTLSEQKLNADRRKVLLQPGAAVFSRFSLAGKAVAFAGNTPEHPNELFTFDLKKRKLIRRTELNPWLKEKSFGKQEVLRYRARDGLEIEGVLIYPVGYSEGKRYPLIVYVHGGPEACVKNGWETSYSRWGQVAAGRGYFVFMPNYRGSSGRGVAFSKMDQGDLVGPEFEDVLDGIAYLETLGLIDARRVGIGGGSYGGYFSAWGATRYSKFFAAAVVFVGISDQMPKLYESDIPWEMYLVHWLHWPQDDPQLFYDRSPVKYAKGAKTPTLILHGKADPRVNPSQSLELYNALKIHGKAPVRLVYYPGEGHGNRRNPARLDFSLRTLEWFDYYLQSDKPKDQMPPKYLKYKLDEVE
ncbi:MAG TPA: S9 family peptidase [Bacteroidetes bacterium]|nr:S9 family peptidase [Bacteroidota bacterium]